MARHMGELLTVTLLGGACFGLPTTLVGERERGIWRRYRLVPIATPALLAAIVAARYVLLVPAALLQVALAMGIGMPPPQHPASLFAAFTCVAFAFLGLGLVIAMMADTVPAVQALGQSIFLPMLIVGGVAVPLAALPEWAQRVSAFFPGRYAVEALQSAVTGDGVRSVGFAIGALLLTGTAAIVAAAAMFRWDTQERFMASGRKAWAALAIAAWIAIGIAADARLSRTTPVRAEAPAPAAATATRTPEPAPAAGTPPLATADAAPATPAPRPRVPAPWREVTREQIAAVSFDKLPPDSGVVAPIAGPDESPDTAVIKQLVQVRRALEEWPPAQVPDPVQRVRNYLLIAAVPDIYQIPLERHVPLLLFDAIEKEIPPRDLVRILYWIAEHPEEGDTSALAEMHAFGLGSGPGDLEEVRERVRLYALKLLRRLAAT
jgi:ABC-2 type transport system permease protein